MKSFREQTYYELLEVSRSSSPEEVRAALRRALESCAPDSVALYALVDEEQAEALRRRLQEAARVLLDPAARAGYERMLGLEPEPAATALWEEDEEDEAPDAVAAGAETSSGLYPRTETAQLEPTAPGLSSPGSQASLKLETPPPRWPSRALGGALPKRPPGLPAPPPSSSAPSTPGGVARQPVVADGAAEAVAMRRPVAEREASAERAAAPTQELPRMPDLPPDVEFNGELLRQVREARGLTLQQLAERTRIGRSHLERVEADRYADLPPSVYLRGILMNLARELKLDAVRVSKSYLLLAARSGQLQP